MKDNKEKMRKVKLAYFWQLHISAQERGDDKRAKIYFDKFNNL